MEKKNIDWANIGFSYMPTDMRYVSNYKDGAWDEGTLTADANVTINECWILKPDWKCQYSLRRNS